MANNNGANAPSSGPAALWKRLKQIAERYARSDNDEGAVHALDEAIGYTLPHIPDEVRRFYHRELLEQISARRHDL